MQNTEEEGDSNPPLIAVRYPAYGARQGRIVIQRTFFPSQSPCYTNSLYLFILLSSEKNEPRSAAAVIGLLACRYGRRRGLRNSLRSNSPRPFPSVFLASSPPDKGGIGDCALACILTPSPYGHSPYILLYKTPRNATGHGRGGG